MKRIGNRRIENRRSRALVCPDRLHRLNGIAALLAVGWTLIACLVRAL